MGGMPRYFRHGIVFVIGPQLFKARLLFICEPLLRGQQCFPVLIQRIITQTSTGVFLPLQSLPTRSEFIACQAHYVEGIHNAPGGRQEFFTRCRVALESIHRHNADL